MTLRTKKFRF